MPETRPRLTAVAVMTAAWLLAGCVTINLLPLPGPLKEEELSGTGDAKVLMIELSGLISSQGEGGFVEQPNMVARFKEEIAKAAEDPQVSAIVLRINSPGGTVTASDIMWHEIKLLKQKRKIPVIASIMDVGASGGYYIAAAADKIVVHPSTITGSIGVIMLTMNANGLMEKIGLHAQAVTSGPKKDMGSPFRPMTEEEKAIFQAVIDSFYDRFLTVVKEGRPNLSPEQVRKLADGRIYSGEQAKAFGLVDAVGYLDEAVELAKQQAGVKDARLVVYRRAGEYKPNIYARLLGSPQGLSALNFDLMGLVRNGTPQFMYLWMP
jgi:protease IV